MSATAIPPNAFHDANRWQAFFENDDGLEQSTRWHNMVFDEAQQLGAAEYTYVGSHRYHGIVLVRMTTRARRRILPERERTSRNRTSPALASGFTANRNC